MSLMRRIFQNDKQEGPRENISLAKFFHSDESGLSLAFNLALKDLENLEATVKNEEELFLYLLEDSIFSSLYITFYEQMLVTIKDNPDLMNAMLDNFTKDSDEREKLIGQQAQNHVQFVESRGLCHGCSSCENHTDLAELIEPWSKGDMDFLMTLYIGMQTIFHAFDDLLYDIAPTTPSALSHFTKKELLNYRQYIYRYAEKTFAGD